MKTTLVAFGCSFVEGAGLAVPHEQNVARCVADRLGLAIDNRAQGGSGLEDHVAQLRVWLETCNNPQDCLILLGLSDSHRVSFPCLDGGRRRPIPAYLLDPQNFVTKWPQFKAWAGFLDFYFQTLDVDQMARDRYWWVTNLFSYLCHRHGIALAMFHVWDPPQPAPRHHDALDVECMIKWAYHDKHRHLMVLPDGHTTAKANEIYSQLLTEQILQRKIL